MRVKSGRSAIYRADDRNTYKYDAKMDWIVTPKHMGSGA